MRKVQKRSYAGMLLHWIENCDEKLELAKNNDKSGSVLSLCIPRGSTSPKKLYVHDLIDYSIFTDMATCDVAVDTD